MRRFGRTRLFQSTSINYGKHLKPKFRSYKSLYLILWSFATCPLTGLLKSSFKYLKEISLNADLLLKFILVDISDLNKCVNRFNFNSPGHLHLELGEFLSSRRAPRCRCLILLPVNSTSQYCRHPSTLPPSLPLFPLPDRRKGVIIRELSLYKASYPPPPALPLSPTLLWVLYVMLLKLLNYVNVQNKCKTGFLVVYRYVALLSMVSLGSVFRCSVG